jgi:hypothetical protein
MATCSGCDAEIVWALTAKDKRVPLDAKPEKRYVLAPVLARDDFGFIAAVIHHDERAQLVDTFMPHHATCPNVDEFRRGGAR